MVCERDWGSFSERADSGRVVRRLRYAAVVGSEAGGGRGEGASKYGVSSSYNGSAMANGSCEREILWARTTLDGTW